jgi:hypothetical protein
VGEPQTVAFGQRGAGLIHRRPDATSADRDRLFSQWVAGLGLPLKDELAGFELTRVGEAGGTSALLIESPEPLDFTEEITVTLTRRVQRPPWGGGLPIGPQPPVAAAADAPGSGPSIRGRLEALAAEPALTGRGTMPGGRAPEGEVPDGGVLPPPEDAILDVRPAGTDLALELSPALGGAGRLDVIAIEPTGRVLFTGMVRPGALPRQPATMLAQRVGLLGALPAGSELTGALAHATAGMVFLTTTDLMRLIGVWPPGPTDIPIPVQMLQSGDARRAILVPLAGPQATTLAPAQYRITLALLRKRWQTTEPADALNAYQSSTTLLLDL